jgi:flagellar biosynthesis protein FlhG
MSSPGGDQASRMRARASAARTRVITITSGKGGVGKTSLVANLALELTRAGATVLVLDGDLGLANLSILFNVAPRHDLEDVIEGRRPLADVVVEVMPGLRLIPASSGAAALADLSTERRLALMEDVRKFGTGIDYLLIDTGAGISATVLGLVTAADRAFVVTTHEPTALSDAYALIKAARGRGAHRLDVIVNMAQSHTQARETHARLVRVTERFLGYTPSLVAVIPRDACVGEAVVRQEPLTTIYPYAPATRAVAGLARLLQDDTGSPHERAFVSLAVPVRR